MDMNACCIPPRPQKVLLLMPCRRLIEKENKATNVNEETPRKQNVEQTSSSSLPVIFLEV